MSFAKGRSTMRATLSIVLASSAWVLAQTTSAPPPPAIGFPSCTLSNFQWAFNSDNQSPCQIASSLGAACIPGLTSLPIPALGPNQFYSGPAVGHTTDCQCSSVYYSVLSACALCQGAAVIEWRAYNVNCSTPFLAVFDVALPPGLKVPHYAYLDVSQGNGAFQQTIAEAAGGAESSAIPQPTASTSTSSPHKKSHAGAIAGGVVGGLIGLLLLVALVFWLLRWRSRRRGPGPIYDEHHSEVTTTLGDSRSPYGATPKLYDPNDPSSFPATMAQLTGSTNSFPSQGRQQHIQPGFTGAHSKLSHPNAQYTGVAEVM